MTKDEIRQRIRDLEDEIEELRGKLYNPTPEELAEFEKQTAIHKALVESHKGLDRDTLARSALDSYDNPIDALRLIRDATGLGLKEAKELWDKHRK